MGVALGAGLGDVLDTIIDGYKKQDKKS